VEEELMHPNEIKLKTTMADVFGVGPESIGEDSSMDTVDEWDSTRHLNLVLALENSFSLSLSEEQVVEIISYPLIKLVLNEHGVLFS
jgi:acyl carrier protein